MTRSVRCITRPKGSDIIKSAIITLGLFAGVSCTKAIAQGDLLISPLRIIFEGGKKSQEVNLANTGKDTASYIVSMMNLKMNEDGSFVQVDTPEAGQNFAEKYLRFFPHRVSLAPGEAQVVKIQLVKTAEMMPGEYRSHLYFRSVPDEKPLGEAPAKKDTGAISIKLTPIYGITIPVIIRSGETTSDVTLSDLSLDMTNAVPTLKLTFNRTGNISVYGDVVVNHIAPDGTLTLAKLVKGLGVYTPNPARHARIDLDNDPTIDYHKGKLHVIYSVQMSDKSVKKVEAELELK